MLLFNLGEYNVTLIETYMQALEKFKKGDKTKVKYKRGNETMESDIQF